MKLPNLFRAMSDRPLRLPRLQPYIPRASDPPIFWFQSEREDIIAEVGARIETARVRSREATEQVLNSTALGEIRRLEQQSDAETAERLRYWKSLTRKIAKLDQSELRDAVRDISLAYAKDVAGNFDPRVYAMARHAVPKLLTGVLSPSRLPEELIPNGETFIDELLHVEGEIPLLKKLETRGTLVYVPTHSSNLDSVVLGRALDQAGLSPVVYGAGKNLFSNPVLSFFMHNLGAYRVDRRIQAELYKDVLKTYSQIMVERGYHSLFFPGGTRSRSNLVESHLKLGLAGSAVTAFSQNAVRGVRRPIYFVPTTINYELVLEAETLINEWLKDAGKARYIITDDESSRVDRWVAFFRKIVGMQGFCVMRFGRPVDCFGNEVDDEGHSLAPNGTTIDPLSYVSFRGVATLDSARDAAYTRDLGERIVKGFHQETVIMATHIVAHVLFRRLARETPGLDLFSRLRVRGEVTIGRDALAAEVGLVRDDLVRLEKSHRVRLNQELHDAAPHSIVARALAMWNGYHRKPAVTVDGTTIKIEDPTLLLYYQNRLAPLALDLVRSDADERAARDIIRIAKR